jgi:hypothetical protein
MKPVFNLWMLQPKSTQTSECTNVQQTSRKAFEQMLSVFQIADVNCFLGQERSSDYGIHAARDHDNIRTVLRNTKGTA